MSLFDNLTPSQTDCSDESNANNALLDLNRALDRGGSDELAGWARLYGPTLCNAAISAAGFDEEAQQASGTIEHLTARLEHSADRLEELMELVEELRPADPSPLFEKIDGHYLTLRYELTDENQPSAKAAA